MTTTQVSLDGAVFDVRPSESLLDACLRSGIEIPFSCRGGVCQNCMLRCTEGKVPERAQRGLAERLAAKGYLLACQCHPDGPMTMVPPDRADRLTTSMLLEAKRAGEFVFVRFETARELECKAGQTLFLADDSEPRLQFEVTASQGEFTIEALVRCTADTVMPDWLLANEFGHEFTVSGPVTTVTGQEADELSAPETDPALWKELKDGATVRAVLEDFYRKVYLDPQLAPFFHGVTIERSIDKQYSFLRQLMTGERIYFGDRPRNAHHWMVISDTLFDYRQSLMQRTLAAHGLSDDQIARWTRLELHYRPDMVKDHAWPKRFGGVEIPADGFADEVLLESSVCDYCGEAVQAGTRVRYHLRLGKINCPSCAEPVTDGGKSR